MERFRKISLVVMALLYSAAGVNHFISPEFYRPMMPAYLPWHDFLIYLSGAIEIVFGVSLFFEKTRTLAAWGIILLLIAVFPAHIHMYQNPQLFPEIDGQLLFWRMPFQLVFIGWAYSHTRP
ncbi:hypothetical protein N9D31_03160 [Oligoflexaceae bacterium]|nr:hypothetical protein [Oligoflexaceae bacterium]